MATLSSPRVYKDKWLVWSDAVFDSIDVESCDDTISGVCKTHRTVDECIDACTDGCGAGYHVEFEDGSTVCVPILTDIYPLLSPVRTLKPKSLFPRLSKIAVSSFVNQEIYPFPPDTANAVFFQDILNISSGTLQLSAGVHIGAPLIFENNVGSNLQIVPVIPINSRIVRNMPLTYGIIVDISVPGTALAGDAIVNSPGFMWKSVAQSISNVQSGFILVPLDHGKKEGDIVSYGDKFSLKYGSTSTCVVPKSTGILESSRKDLSVLQKDHDIDTVFSLKSRMIGYYCHSGECKSVPISQTSPTGSSARYKGATVGRFPGCQGTCKEAVVKGSVVEGGVVKRKVKLATIIASVVGILVLIGVGLVSFFWLRRTLAR
jgi:hypothetical protein